MAAEFNVNILPFNQSGTFSCSQYDVGRTATITLLDEEGEYTIPTGATVTINATKPSGFGFSEECDWDGSTVTIETTATMTEEAGKFPAELRITSGDTVLVSANFLFRVEESAHPDNVVDGDAETAQALTIRVTALESAVTDLQSAISRGTGLTTDVKEALLTCFQNVAWINEHGQEYYDALEEALYPPANLVSISAVYTQIGDVYDNQSLDSLKSNLVVTAFYDNSTSEIVTTYILSGTLTTGTSTITAAYGGKTATFDVVVTHATTQYTITNTLTHCTNSNSATVINELTSYSGMLTAATGYVMSSATITMGNTDITSTSYDAATGAISIGSVTGNILITAEAVEDVGWISGRAYDIEWSEAGTNIGSSGAEGSSSNPYDHASSFLPIHGASAIVISGGYGDYVYFYDENQTFILRNAFNVTAAGTPYYVPVPRNAYFARYYCRKQNPAESTATPYLFPKLTESTVWQLNTYYSMDFATDSDTGVESGYGLCYGATKLQTSMYSRSWVKFYNAEKTKLSETIRQVNYNEITIPDGTYYITLTPNGNVNPWVIFTA